MPSPPNSVRQLAALIDHSLLHPTFTTDALESGLKFCRNAHVATACITPSTVPLAAEILKGSDVGVCPVVGFPHGTTSTAVKVYEAAWCVREAKRVGGQDITVEVDVVVNVGWVLGAEWEKVEAELREVNDEVVKLGATAKVIFETDFLNQDQIRRLCEVCVSVGVAFVKTSTGFGFVKRDNGGYGYTGATESNLALMRKTVGDRMGVKASGGVRNLDSILSVVQAGANRVGASATEAILDEARRRGWKEE
jgi:deoxyribose-phosphate aldolase